MIAKQGLDPQSPDSHGCAISITSLAREAQTMKRSKMTASDSGLLTRPNSWHPPSMAFGLLVGGEREVWWHGV